MRGRISNPPVGDREHGRSLVRDLKPRLEQDPPRDPDRVRDRLRPDLDTQPAWESSERNPVTIEVGNLLVARRTLESGGVALQRWGRQVGTRSSPWAPIRRSFGRMPRGLLSPKRVMADLRDVGASRV